ncbi:PREDICTED: uncharacterized protein LOC104569843 [Tinamus guttatus]|uniref:uncharacterized protein LOC104569843 n=1 Tax=Tinamus guttatus TaxID=94827 RepID=UPI00052F24ED|nr:PREDICTED: uncharacterized protein LOC104569843 [Tinamus guttatus]
MDQGEPEPKSQSLPTPPAPGPLSLQVPLLLLPSPFSSGSPQVAALSVSIRSGELRGLPPLPLLEQLSKGPGFPMDRAPEHEHCQETLCTGNGKVPSKPCLRWNPPLKPRKAPLGKSPGLRDQREQQQHLAGKRLLGPCISSPVEPGRVQGSAGRSRLWDNRTGAESSGKRPAGASTRRFLEPEGQTLLPEGPWCPAGPREEPGPEQGRSRSHALLRRLRARDAGGSGFRSRKPAGSGIDH